MTVLDQVNIEAETVEVEIFTKTQAGLAALEEKYAEFPDPSESKESYDAVKAGVKELTSLRTSIEAKRKEVKQPYLEACRIIDGQAKGIIERIVAIEEPMKAAKKEVDEREKREKEARLKRLNDRIQEMRDLVRQARNATSDAIEQVIEQVEAVDHQDFYELREEALKVRDECLSELSEIYSQRLDYERTAKQREAERKAREEEQRVNGIKERINKCKMIPLDYMGRSSADIETVISKVSGMAIEESEFAEFTEEANEAKRQTLRQLNAMLDQQKLIKAMQPKEEPQPEPQPVQVEPEPEAKNEPVEAEQVTNEYAAATAIHEMVGIDQDVAFEIIEHIKLGNIPSVMFIK